MSFIIALLLLTNADRVKPLTLDTGLTIAAQHRVHDLCKTGQWSHAGFQAYFGDKYGGYIGENLARGFGDNATSTNAALMASPTHYANIVSSHYHKIGIAHECDTTVELFAQ